MLVFATVACAAVVLVQTSFMQHNGFEFLQRINILVGQKKFGDALKLAATFYQGQAKAVVGLPRKAAERKQVVKQQVSARQVVKQQVSARQVVKQQVSPRQVVKQQVSARQVVRQAAGNLFLAAH